MPSSYTTSLRFTLQATGENLNTWGNILNAGCFSLVDTAIAGRYSTTSTAVTLTSSQGAADQARNAILDVTGGTGTTITAPAVSKIYFVRNASSGDVVVTTSGASTYATLKTGERMPVFCDGTNFYRVRILDMGGDRLQNVGTPTMANDAVTKQYADGLAFASTNLPGINAGTAGMFVTNNGSIGYWDWDAYQGRVAITSGPRTVALADRSKWLDATAAANFVMDAATTLQSKYDVILSNGHTAAITVGVTGADTIDGRTSITLAPGDRVRLAGDGVSAFKILQFYNINPGPQVIVQDQKSNGTSGGASSATSYQTRTLNTTVRNAVGATISTNTVALAAGTWLIEARAPAYNTNQHRARIYNQTDTATAVLGPANNASSTANTQTDATVSGLVTITSAKTFRLEHYTNSAFADGLGSPVSSGETEVYAQFFATRVWP